MSAEPSAPISLQQLSEAWNRFGCSICSHVPSPYALEGSKIELHHILPRSQGGTDDQDNIMGLCGELTEEKCHWQVTNHHIEISWSENAKSWIWQTADESTIGFCRPLDFTLIDEVGVGDALVSNRLPLDGKVAIPIPEEWMPNGVVLGAGTQAAQARFMVARELHTMIERNWLQLSLVLRYGMSHRDHLELGFRTVGEWADAIGISKPAMSKLRLVSQTFQGSWVDLSKQDQEALSMEGLYIAARMVKLGHWTAEQALHEAVSHPVGYLWQAHEDVARQGIEMCQCPTCGGNHKKKLEPPLE